MASINIASPILGASGSINLADPFSLTGVGLTAGLKPGASFGVGAEGTFATSLIRGTTIDAVLVAFGGLIDAFSDDSAQDYRGPDMSITSPFYGGTYGGPNRQGSYSDNGTNYGGRDGNAALAGSVIAGFN